MEHIERAGVHSGDSMAVYPGVNLTEKEVETIVDYTIRIGLGLKVKGLMNIQFVIMPGSITQESSVYVLEVNHGLAAPSRLSLRLPACPW